MEHTYSIASDTANAKVDSPKLTFEIESSSIVPTLDRIDTSGDELKIHFTSALSAGEITTLTGLVNSHDGEPIPVVEETNVVQTEPFASKALSNGKKLSSRVHGESFSVTSASNPNVLDFSVPYPQVKFNELEIIGGELGDKCNLKILDTAAGTYTTIPNFQLNQFGFDTNVKPDYYDRASNYDADLYQGMRIYIEYDSISNKTVYINYILHELKD